MKLNASKLFMKLKAQHELRKMKAEILINAVRSGNFDGIIDTVKYHKGLESIRKGELHITDYCAKEAGKMIGVPAFGTTCHVCESCQRNILAAIEAQDLNCPCLHCYSSLGTVYDFDALHLIVNHDRLQEYIPENELKDLAKHAVKIATSAHKIEGITYEQSMAVRIQHKGDVDSVIEVLNYFRFAKLVKDINPNVNVTAYTKFPETYAKAMHHFPDEANKDVLRIGYSCYKMGKEGIEETKNIRGMFPFIDFAFIVYEWENGTKDHTNEENTEYIENNFSELVNTAYAACKCGKGSCGKCKICYHASEFTIVFEECR